MSVFVSAVGPWCIYNPYFNIIHVFDQLPHRVISCASRFDDLLAVMPNGSTAREDYQKLGEMDKSHWIIYWVWSPFFLNRAPFVRAGSIVPMFYGCFIEIEVCIVCFIDCCAALNRTQVHSCVQIVHIIYADWCRYWPTRNTCKSRFSTTVIDRITVGISRDTKFAHRWWFHRW